MPRFWYFEQKSGTLTIVLLPVSYIDGRCKMCPRPKPTTIYGYIMKRFYVLLFVCFLIYASLAVAQTRDRDPAREEQYLQELKKIAPKAGDAFTAATRQVDNGEYAEAIEGYNAVLKQAPNFEPAMRRLAYAMGHSGKLDEGLALSRKVVDLNRSADNLLSLGILTLIPRGDDAEPTKAQMETAFPYLVESAQKSSDTDSDPLVMVAEVALRLDKIDVFESTVTKLTARFPDDLSSHYFRSIALANHGDFDTAIGEVKTAVSLGLAPEDGDEMIAAMKLADDEAHPLKYYLPYIWGFIAIAGGWMLGLVGLYFVGRLLSAKTLATIESSDPNDLSGGGHSSLKATYRRLINFAGLYYYISQPVIVALLIVVTAGVVYGFFMVGHIPIGFLIGFVIVSGGSIFYMFKSLIIRPTILDPGRVLLRDEAPGLWELIESVAAEVKTRPIDEVRVTMGVEVAVYQRGGFREKRQDKGVRVLILGVGAFNGFSANGFRAVLAHEYGHFSNRDTAGGDIAFRVNDDMVRLAEAMINSGNNTYHNLTFHFLRLYHFIFRRITHGASRLQEVLADRVAVHNYGAAAFTEGLTHVIRQDIVFTRLADAEISAALSDRRKFNNLYDLTIGGDGSVEIETAFKNEFDRPTVDDDTHPSGVDRVRLAQKIAGQTHINLEGALWELFVDRESLVDEMNLMAEQKIRGERYTNYHDTGIADAAR